MNVALHFYSPVIMIYVLLSPLCNTPTSSFSINSFGNEADTNQKNKNFIQDGYSENLETPDTAAMSNLQRNNAQIAPRRIREVPDERYSDVEDWLVGIQNGKSLFPSFMQNSADENSKATDKKYNKNYNDGYRGLDAEDGYRDEAEDEEGIDEDSYVELNEERRGIPDEEENGDERKGDREKRSTFKFLAASASPLRLRTTKVCRKKTKERDEYVDDNDAEEEEKDEDGEEEDEGGDDEEDEEETDEDESEERGKNDTGSGREESYDSRKVMGILKTNIGVLAIWIVGICVAVCLLTCGCFYLYVVCLDTKKQSKNDSAHGVELERVRNEGRTAPKNRGENRNKGGEDKDRQRLQANF